VEPARLDAERAEAPGEGAVSAAGRCARAVGARRCCANGGARLRAWLRVDAATAGAVGAGSAAAQRRQRHEARAAAAVGGAQSGVCRRRTGVVLHATAMSTGTAARRCARVAAQLRRARTCHHRANHSLT
jgi:hypothetical protein